MRFRAVLVDDEPWILEGMRVLLPWKEYGLIVESTYTDPFIAYEAVRKNPPDVIFVDIRMPEMSGIELLRKLRAHGIDAAFLMVSGHAEFDYAQEALRLGVFDYLTKPVELDTIHTTFAKLHEKLTSNRIARGLAAIDALSFETAAKPYLDPGGINTEGWLAAFTSADPDDAHAWAEQIVPGGVWRSDCLAPGRSLLVLRTNVLAAASMRADCGMETGAMIGLSGYGAHVRDMPKLLREAYLAYRQRYIDPHAHFCAFERGRMEGMQPLALEIRQKAERPAELSALFERLTDVFRREGMQAVHAEQLWNFCAAVSGLPIRPCTAEDLLAQFHSMDEQCAHLAELARTSGPVEMKDSAKRLINEQFLQMLREVEDNYHRPLSLRTLSARYFLNLSYVSELFRRVTGATFTEYVTKLRMTRAVDLMESNMELQEIARQVGYEDYFYFSKVFKKNFGLSPTQYRARN